MRETACKCRDKEICIQHYVTTAKEAEIFGVCTCFKLRLIHYSLAYSLVQDTRMKLEPSQVNHR